MSDASAFKKEWPQTIFEVSYGGSGRNELIRETKRYFGPGSITDAVQIFAEKVIELDQNKLVNAAWVHLRRLPDSIYPKGMDITAWTKISDERPIRQGFNTPDEALGS